MLQTGPRNGWHSIKFITFFMRSVLMNFISKLLLDEIIDCLVENFSFEICLGAQIFLISIKFKFWIFQNEPWWNHVLPQKIRTWRYLQNCSWQFFGRISFFVLNMQSKVQSGKHKRLDHLQELLYMRWVLKKEKFIKTRIQQTWSFTQLAVMFSISSPSPVKKRRPHALIYLEELLDFNMH
jgi:hypothetical protein